MDPQDFTSIYQPQGRFVENALEVLQVNCMSSRTVPSFSSGRLAWVTPSEFRPTQPVEYILQGIPNWTVWHRNKSPKEF